MFLQTFHVNLSPEQNLRWSCVIYCPALSILYFFYVDRHVFLVEVSGPADPVLERRVVPGVHLSLRVVEKLKLEGKKKNKHTHEPFAKAEVPNATEGAPHAAKPGKGRGTAGASSGTHARRGFRSHGSNPVSVGETNSHVTSHFNFLKSKNDSLCSHNSTASIFN